MDAKLTPTRFAAWFALVLLVLYLVLVGGGWIGIYDVGLRVFSLALVVIVLAVWAIVAMRRPDWRPGSSIWPALLVPLAALAISTVLSRDARLGVEYVAWSVLLVALYLLAQRLLAHPYFRPRVMSFAVLLCVLVSVLYIAACLMDWVAWWQLVGRISQPPLRPAFARLTFGNPSAVMTIVVLLFASAVGYLGSASTMRRIALLVLTGLVLAVTLLSGSRAGWIGLAVAVAGTAALWLLVAGNRAAVRRAFGTRRARAALAGAAAVGVVVVVALAPTVVSRAMSGGEALRATFFAIALQMGLEAPVVGSGPGTWAARRIALTPATETDLYIPHAHDIYLQTFAETGLLGLAAGAIAVGCVVWLIARSIRSGDAARVRFGWCALFATLYFGGHQLLDFYPNMPAALFAFALPIAWLDAASDRSIASLDVPRTWRRIGGALAVAAIVAAVGVLAWSEASALRLDEAVRTANRGDWLAAAGPAEAAAEQDPRMPANQFTLGLVAAHTGDAAGAERALAVAAASDDLPVAWLDLAAVQVSLGKDLAARASLEHALRLGAQQPAIAFGAGDLYLRLGDVAAANDSFAAAIRAAPSLAGDPYWTAREEVAAAWPGILDAAIAGMSPETGFDAALSAGGTGRAREIASRIESSDMRSLANLVIAAWTGDEAPFADLAAYAAAQPLDMAAVTWAARVASRRGDEVAARRFRRWADILNEGAGAAAREIRVSPYAGSRTGVAGLSGLYYGHFTYRRPTPWDQLVPDLPGLSYQ